MTRYSVRCCQILRVSGEAEAIAVANNTQHGLASAVWSRDRKRAERVAHQIEADFTNINDITVLQDIYVQFGGIKKLWSWPL